MSEVIPIGVDPFRTFYDFVKDFSLFHSSPDYPSFDELEPEQQRDILWNTWQRQIADRPEDTEGWGAESPEMLYDLYQKIKETGAEPPEELVDDLLNNPLGADFDLTEEYPALTEGQVAVLSDATQEVYRRVDAGEYDWEQAREAIGRILDSVGVPYDPDSLRVEGGGISDNGGLISNRYVITENPDEAVAGGGGGDMSASDILAEVGAPGAGSPGGADDDYSRVATYDAERNVFVFPDGSEYPAGDPIANGPTPTDGGRYSVLVDQNGVAVAEHDVGDAIDQARTNSQNALNVGLLAIPGLAGIALGNIFGGGGNGNTGDGSGPGGGDGNNGGGNGGDYDGDFDGDTDDGPLPPGEPPGQTPGTPPGDGGGPGGPGSGDGGGGRNPAQLALNQPSQIAEIFRPELYKTNRADISHLINIDRLRRIT